MTSLHEIGTAMEKTHLSNLELKVMEAIWRLEEASVNQIQEFLQKTDKVHGITTISTILKRLQNKGAVDFRKAGRQYIYRSLLPEKGTKSSMANDLVNQLFGGRTSVLVDHLLESDSVDPDELEQLQAMINEARKKRSK